MKRCPDERVEPGRERSGYFASMTGDQHGAFLIMGPFCMLKIVSSGHDRENGWEHVSVSTKNRTPNWREMCFVKDLFWGPEECVVQFHPPRSEYVNHHPNCLHLWAPIGEQISIPPSILVGPKTEEVV